LVSYKKYLDIEVFEGKLSTHQYPWHFHKCYTIVLVEKGSITYELEDQKVEVGENEVFIIEPFLIHRNKISQLTIYKAIFIPNEYLALGQYKKIGTQLIRLQSIVNCIIDLLDKIKLNEHNQAFNSSLVELQALIDKLPQKHSVDSNSQHKIIPEIEYDLTINELSKKAHMSKFHFQRKFKQSNGLTVGQLKQQEKTIKAKTLLEKGKLSTDVAHELGFFDQSHFIKYFKKMWATTPKKFK
jgi:AraC-like DNA-binding protein